MNVEIGTEAAQFLLWEFPEKKYINGIFVAVWCKNWTGISHLCTFNKEKPLKSICKNSKKISRFTPFKIISLFPAVQNLNPPWREAREKSSPQQIPPLYFKSFPFSIRDLADIVRGWVFCRWDFPHTQFKGAVSRDVFGFWGHAWPVLGQNRGRGQFLNFFGAQIIHNAKTVFLVVNANFHWLINVSGVYLIQVSLLLIGQQGLGYFFMYRPLLSIGWRVAQILRQRPRKSTNTAPATLSAIQASSKSTLSMNNYTPLVINIIKPTQTGNNLNKETFCIIKSSEPL